VANEDDEVTAMIEELIETGIKLVVQFIKGGLPLISIH
jgi:hypothetical protein